jgi:uncharacterized protein (TIGR00251 family)
VGLSEGTLEVAVAAPPVDGEANAELIRTLVRELGLKKSSIQIVKGETSREKLLKIAMEPDELERLLGRL